MDEINAEFPRTDVALVIGANDVVNPAARTDPASRSTACRSSTSTEAVGDRAQAVDGTGFAGIENPLFYAPNTSMLFGDAKTRS